MSKQTKRQENSYPKTISGVKTKQARKKLSFQISVFSKAQKTLKPMFLHQLFY